VPRLRRSEPVELAATRVCPVYKGQRVRVATDDWTPGAVAGRATRHYVVGDASEIRELADALAARDPRLRALLDADVGGDLDPAHAPAVREAPPTPQLPKDVVGTPPPKMTADDVHAFLVAAGVENVEDNESVNPCLKQAMLRGHVPMRDPATFMDVVLHEGRCLVCSAAHVCTVRDALHQWVRGGDYGDGGPGGAVQCEECCGLYVTNLCGGRPRFDCGKGHNHCLECPGFGEYVGDIRNHHCHRCGDHYFAGFMGGRCPCRSGGQTERWDGFGYVADESSSGDDSDGGEAPLPPAAAFDAVLPGLAAALPDTIVQWVMTPETISQQMDVLKTLTPEDIKRMFAEAGYMGPQEQAPH